MVLLFFYWQLFYDGCKSSLIYILFEAILDNLGQPSSKLRPL